MDIKIQPPMRIPLSSSSFVASVVAVLVPLTDIDFRGERIQSFHVIGWWQVNGCKWLSPLTTLWVSEDVLIILEAETNVETPSE